MDIKRINCFFIGLITSLPWLWVSYGGWKSNVSSDLIISFLIISLFIFVTFYYSCCNVKLSSEVQLYNRYWYLAFIVINFVVLFGRMKLSYDYNFQLGLVRHIYFSESGDKMVFFGSSLFSAIYSKIIVPFTIVMLILPTKEKILSNTLFAVMIISFSLIGGRFFIYYMCIIIILKQLLNNRIFTNQLYLVFSLLFFSCYIIAIRLGTNIIDSIFYIFQQIENYHVIQLPIISEYNKFPISLSPFFIGGDTIVSYFLGMTPSETLLAGYLQDVSVYSYNGDGPFNAFGTSLAYFYPLLGVTGGTILFLSFFSILYWPLFILFKHRRRSIIILFGFLIYFSAFAPLLFSFSSYCFLAIFIFSCIKIRKDKDRNRVKLLR